uniref:Tellurite resistance methyltransferase TehB-like domain-containing protein n=1 Tax=viral metagenome TaxID=1070528 RepID=A0A6C0JVC9_9ZZZZ
MDDKNYWQIFYSTNTHNIDCSNFCIFVMDYFKDKNILNILDCGCGNGRDSYALSIISNVDAVDNCGFLNTNTNNVKFYMDDFVTMNKSKYDLIYSRFTFHSITNDQHNSFLDTINVNSYLAIETRSTKGEKDSVFHGKTHYRNYTDIDYLKNILTLKNFEILYIMEEINYAKYNNENPVCIRVICKKKESPL